MDYEKMKVFIRECQAELVAGGYFALLFDNNVIAYAEDRFNEGHSGKYAAAKIIEQFKKEAADA